MNKYYQMEKDIHANDADDLDKLEEERGNNNNNIIKNNEEQSNKKDQSFVERVLVLSGGGSLGAYECGACSEFYKRGLKFNVFAGCSIGSINVSILASAQNAGKDPAKTLREFWTELSEDLFFVDSFSSSQSSLQSSSSSSRGSSMMNDPLALFYSSTSSAEKARAILASTYTAFFGTPKAFIPRWFTPAAFSDISDISRNMLTEWWNPFTYFPFAWKYLYDSEPLKRTLKDFVDLDALRKNPDAGSDETKPARIIIPSTDIQHGVSVIFDNTKTDIDIERILAGASYPFYGIKWHKLDNRYLWDGSLLSNTPFAEVLFASPSTDKEFYIVDIFPRQQDQIPQNMAAVWHRARDILFLDKADKSMQMAQQKKDHIALIKKMNQVLSEIEKQYNAEIDGDTKRKIKQMARDYKEIMDNSGAVIQRVIRVTRSEKIHYILEDADFTKARISKLIDQGQSDAKNELDKYTNSNNQQGESQKQAEYEHKTQDGSYHVAT